MPNFKEISSLAAKKKKKLILKVLYSKNHLSKFSPLANDQVNWSNMNFNKLVWSGSILDFIQINHKFVRKCAKDMLLSHAIMILNEDQGH